MKNFLEENLNFLKNNAPALHAQLINGEDDTGAEAFWDGRRRLLKVKKGAAEVTLGSAVNPKREAERLFAASDENAGLVILLGVGGLGLLGAIKERFRRLRRLVIIEPSRNIFRALLEEMPLKKIFAAFPKTDISIILGDDFAQINNWYKTFVFNYALESAAVLLPVGYASLFPLHRGKLAEFDRDARLQLSGTLVTHQAFRYMWHANQWRNLKLRSAHFSALGEIIRNMPVIIVSSGPSLNENISILREVGDRAFVIACGTAIRILHSRGIVPHLRLSIEGNSLQERLFDGIDPDECPLGYTDFIKSSIARAYDGNCLEIFAAHNYPVKSLLLRSRGIVVPETGSGASVSNLGLFLADTLGAPKIILIGQDLCWRQDKNYADGSWASDKENRWLATYTNRFPLKNMYGEIVYTDSSFVNIKITLEHVALMSRNRHFINATEGGLNIIGFENKRLIDVLAQDLPPAPPVADLRRAVKDAIEGQLLNKLWTEDYALNLYRRCRQEIKSLREEFGVLEEALEKAKGSGKNASVRNRYEKLLRAPLFGALFGNGLSREAKEVREALAGRDAKRQEEAFLAFVAAGKDFTDFSLELAEEFLAGRGDELDIIFQT
ncbi:MAG: DUF115 domain-containing protein [Acidaminococcales bacterium]|jgi:hypothetical protein|nr:DUF115 domain-containing protein [Acidaminococcales bacterium]